MDRKKYLEMCREVAMLGGGMEGVKQGVPGSLLVTYGGKEYYPVKYELGFSKDGTVTHTAVIHDLAANAWFYVPLDKVEMEVKE